MDGAAPRDKIPALVVSGFLGSGKTTLVRHLLDAARTEGTRVGVVSNEFGELGIDASLLADATDTYVELEGGCVCCKLSDELVKTLEELYVRAHPERVIVETSGVALPHDTQIQFWCEPIVRWVEDCLAVVVVSAEQLHSGRDLEGTFEDQVSSADLLVLNKLDLVPSAARPALEGRLEALAPDAPIIGCEHGRLSPELFFPSLARGAASRARRGTQPRPHSHASFRSEELRVRRGIPEAELRAQLEGLGALRIKGFVETSEGPRLVQGVGPRIDLEAAPERRIEDPARLVVIRWDS